MSGHVVRWLFCIEYNSEDFTVLKYGMVKHISKPFCLDFSNYNQKKVCTLLYSIFSLLIVDGLDIIKTIYDLIKALKIIFESPMLQCTRAFIYC